MYYVVMEIGRLAEYAPKIALVTIVALGAAGCNHPGEGQATPDAPAPTATHTTAGGNNNGDRKDEKACHIEATQGGDGYDIKAVVDGGSFSAGTFFTGHVKFRAELKDGWDSFTPGDFRVDMAKSVHYKSPEIYKGKSMKPEIATGVLDPGSHKVRTQCEPYNF